MCIGNILWASYVISNFLGGAWQRVKKVKFIFMKYFIWPAISKVLFYHVINIKFLMGYFTLFFHIKS